MNDISDINKVVLVTFYHPVGPRAYFNVDTIVKKKGEIPDLDVHQQFFKEAKVP